MNECSPPQESMGRHVRNGEMESKRGRRFGHRAKRWMSPRGVCPSANLQERERDSWNGRRDRRRDKTVVWTKNNKGFNKKLISTKLKVLGGKNDLAHSQSLTDTQTVAPQSVPGLDQDTLPPLSGKDLTWPELGQPIHNHHSPLLTSSPFLSLLPLALFLLPFFLLILFFFPLFFEFLGPDGTLGSKEVWVVIVYDVTVVLVAQRKFFLFQSQQFPPFSYSVVLLSHFFKWQETCL